MIKKCKSLMLMLMAVLMLFACENPTDTTQDTDDTTNEQNQTNQGNQEEEVEEFDPQSTLEGSDYFIIQLDELSYGYLETTGATITDLRADEVTKHLYVWDNTVFPQETEGNNYYDLPEQWLSVAVSNAGWSGMGYFISQAAATVDMTATASNPSEYYLHLAVKGTETSEPIVVMLHDGQTEVKIALGGDFVDNGTTFESYIDIPKDNEWHTIEIPMTYLNELGLTYNTPFNNVNIVAFLMGGNEGTTFDIDAVFFYRK